MYFDNTSKSFLYDVKNKQNIYDSDMANHYYYMSSEGFECTDCDAIDEEPDEDRFDDEGVNLDINKKGVKLSIKDGKDKVKVKIDEDGIELR